MIFAKVITKKYAVFIQCDHARNKGIMYHYMEHNTEAQKKVCFLWLQTTFANVLVKCKITDIECRMRTQQGRIA